MIRDGGGGLGGVKRQASSVKVCRWQMSGGRSIATREQA